MSTPSSSSSARKRKRRAALLMVVARTTIVLMLVVGLCAAWGGGGGLAAVLRRSSSFFNGGTVWSGQQRHKQGPPPPSSLLRDALEQVQKAGLRVCVPPASLKASNKKQQQQQQRRVRGVEEEHDDYFIPVRAAEEEQHDDYFIPISSMPFSLPSCADELADGEDFDNSRHSFTVETIKQQQQQQAGPVHRRWLEEEQQVESEEKTTTATNKYGGLRAYLTNLVCALVCISVAALAAGLTLGMLGLDPLLLLIKERAAADVKERCAAATLRPIVQQHHRLLVTLLLMNAVANEALPLFLEPLVPNPAYAVAVSVTLVLFCGEIIPSAIFTGPNQLHIACALVPVVKVVLWLLYPLAGPLAWLLDTLLHHGDGDDDDGHDDSGAYTRGELAALIRIQYEERMAAKLRRKQQRATVVDAKSSFGGSNSGNHHHVGGLDFAQRQSLRAAKHHVERVASSKSVSDAGGLALSVRTNNSSTPSQQQQQEPPEFRESLHVDEVVMIEGALCMKTSTALDVFTSYRKVFCIPSDMLLNEDNMVKIYASGFTRIPVYQAGQPRTAIVGVLMTKQLIVVSSSDSSERPVGTLPLRIPRCVGPDTPLVHLVNLFQTGGTASRGGHLALVCARPATAERALLQGKPVPESAGLMGIITLEDVLEMLLQEQIYDEQDKRERQTHKLAEKVVRRWKNFVRKKQSQRSIEPADNSVDTPPKMMQVVEDAVATARAAGKNDAQAVEEGMAAAQIVAGETTALLGAPGGGRLSADGHMSA